MDKRERLQRTIAGEPVDRPPVALWRHWPMDDQTPEGLAEFATNVTNWHEFFHSCKFVQKRPMEWGAGLWCWGRRRR